MAPHTPDFIDTWMLDLSKAPEANKFNHVTRIISKILVQADEWNVRQALVRLLYISDESVKYKWLYAFLVQIDERYPEHVMSAKSRDYQSLRDLIDTFFLTLEWMGNYIEFQKYLNRPSPTWDTKKLTFPGFREIIFRFKEDYDMICHNRIMSADEKKAELVKMIPSLKNFIKRIIDGAHPVMVAWQLVDMQLMG